MQAHFETTSRFATLADAKIHEGSNIFESEVKDRQLILNVLLHAADLSNMGRPPDIARIWSDLVFEEFLNQVSSIRINL